MPPLPPRHTVVVVPMDPGTIFASDPNEYVDPAGYHPFTYLGHPFTVSGTRAIPRQSSPPQGSVAVDAKHPFGRDATVSLTWGLSSADPHALRFNLDKSSFVVGATHWVQWYSGSSTVDWHLVVAGGAGAEAKIDASGQETAATEVKLDYSLVPWTGPASGLPCYRDGDDGKLICVAASFRVRSPSAAFRKYFGPAFSLTGRSELPVVPQQQWPYPITEAAIHVPVLHQRPSSLGLQESNRHG